MERRGDPMERREDQVSEQVTPLYKSKAFWYVIALVASNALLPQPFILAYTLQSFTD